MALSAIKIAAARGFTSLVPIVLVCCRITMVLVFVVSEMLR